MELKEVKKETDNLRALNTQFKPHKHDLKTSVSVLEKTLIFNIFGRTEIVTKQTQSFIFGITELQLQI